MTPRDDRPDPLSRSPSAGGPGSSEGVPGSEPSDGMTELSGASDAALMVAIGRYNESALAEVYRRHGGAVHGLARRLLGADGRADDVTQEVFVDLWRRPERYDPARGSLRSFLLTRAHGRAVDMLRSDSARAAREAREARETAHAGYDLENHAWDLAQADHVKRAVGALPEAERRAIELAYFAGHTYREVASMLGEAEGTVKSRIRRGLRRLRQALAEEGDPAWGLR
jgi:RNA polymerase sigma-70 factor (ECF subfamily)